MAPPACPDNETFVAFLEGRLDELAQDRFEVHMDQCAKCPAVVAALGRGLRPSELTDTPGPTALEPDLAGDTTFPRFESGDALGRYEIRGPLGYGGMGVVYRAFDSELSREVALKFSRRSDARGDDGELLARAEARAIARLRHPHVVAIYDISTYRGHPFIAMEYVQGCNLAQWLALEPRDWGDVVAIFCDVGRGLDGVHRAGLVHQDFKPGNVLIGEDGRTRIADFGLALIGRPDADFATETEPTGARIRGGTRAYMAPELAHGSVANAQSDQFSFCVALREAVHPLGAPRRIARVIDRGCSANPAHRFSDMSTLLRALQFAGRRRRWRWAAGVLVLLASLAAGLLVSRKPPEFCRESLPGPASLDLARATAAPNQQLRAKLGAALVAHHQAWLTQRQRACTTPTSEPQHQATVACLRLRRAEAVALASVLSEPGAPLGQRALQAIRALPQARLCGGKLGPIAPVAPDQLAEVGALRVELAQAFALQSVGRLGPAAEAADRAIVSAAQIQRPELLCEAVFRRGSIRRFRGDYTAAIADLTEAFELAEAHGVPRIAARSAIDLCLAQYRQAHWQQASSWCDTADARVSPDSLLQADLLLTRASLEGRTGPSSKVRIAALRALSIRERHLGSNAPLTGDALDVLAAAFLSEGRSEIARLHWERAAEIFRQSYGDDHPNVAAIKLNLGIVSGLAGEYTSALRLQEEALRSLRSSLGPSSPHLSAALDAVGYSLVELGRVQEARKVFEESLSIRRAGLDATHPDIAVSLNYLGSARSRLGDIEAAKGLHEAALQIVRSHYGPDHLRVADTVSGLGLVALRSGDATAAVSHYQKAAEIRLHKLGDAHYAVGISWIALARAHALGGETAAALADAERGSAVIGESLGPLHPRTLRALTTLARLQTLAGFTDEAQRTLDDAMEPLNGEPAVTSRTDVRLAMAGCGAAFNRGDTARATRLAREANGRWQREAKAWGPRDLEDDLSWAACLGADLADCRRRHAADPEICIGVLSAFSADDAASPR